ncbi:hypothetical protein V7S43_018628 [Phytophthora oleae]|uniref:Uncharacterized protein n=1 Tax=Phytophthora oleae TaxID=2107226 RepID=A0ABD3EQD5_9STRA
MSTPTTQNDSYNPAASSTTRLTPYERMRQLLAVQNGNAGRVVSAVEDLQAILKNSPEQRDTITMRMKVLWVSDHQHRQLRLARLHFVDADSPEPLDELLKVFRDPYQANAQTIDAMLFTATL